MSRKIYFKNIVSFLLRKVQLPAKMLLIGMLMAVSYASFGQVGPYFYGKPNATTLIPDPPVPAASYYTMGTYEGMPRYLDASVDPINPPSNPLFLNQLIAALPERANRSANLGMGGAADVTITDDSAAVFLVFVTEGAANKNALGYFLYKGDISPNDLNAPNPLVPGKSYLESRRIIFPNASLTGPSPFQPGGGGGRLIPGNQVKMVGDLPNGKFSKGVHIAWFIVSNGWNGTQVDNGNSILYSNPELNNKKTRQAAILDFTSTEGRSIITFEDTRRDIGSDHDFNDVVFYISQKIEGSQTVYYPDCAGKFILTKAEYDALPKDETGKLICTVTPPAVTNLSLTAICSDNPTSQLAWRVTNPNSSMRPYTWIITDGITSTIKLSSATVLNALPGDNIIYTNRISGVNAMTISVEGTPQPSGTKVPANIVACETTPPVPPLNCCAVFASEVMAYKPGTARNGSSLPAARRDSSQALGASGVAGSFVALGFKGGSAATEASIVLKFAKPVRGFINIYETTFGAVSANFVETAEIYGSMDGSSFFKIGVANNQEPGSVDIHRTTLELKGAYAQIQYLKIIDITSIASMPIDADGFDLEAVCASDYALETVVINADAQPGSVKVDIAQTKTAQGKQKDGKLVWSGQPNKDVDPACILAGLCDPEGIDRSNVNSILSRDNTFYSLGYGGSIELKFKEPITGSLILFERTGDPKPSSGTVNYIEKVAVYVKTADCNEWGSPIGYADNQGPKLGLTNSSFDHQLYKSVISLGGRTVQYVKLVDVTPAASTSSDGYDIDFIASTSNATTLSGDALVEQELLSTESVTGFVITSFPNPSTGSLTLDFGYRETGFVSPEPTVISITDMTGNVVFSTVREANSTGEMTLDLTNQRNGLYFVSIYSGNNVVNQKILLQR